MTSTDHHIDIEIRKINDDRVVGVLLFHDKYKHLAYEAKGSSNNHHSWRGGYLDHICETFNIAKVLYKSMNEFRKLDFSLDSCLIVLYFHDIEKIWKYTTGEIINKDLFYTEGIKEFKMSFTDHELNALRYIHGEQNDYSSDKRIMNPLAAFCHCVDTMSSRIWFDQGKHRIA